MNLRNFKGGWICGDFYPAIVETKDLEIGILHLLKGEKGDGHYHLEHTEYNIVIKGCARVNSKLYQDNDIFIYKPLEKSRVEYLEDTTLLVIKEPATKGDKYY